MRPLSIEEIDAQIKSLSEIKKIFEHQNYTEMIKKCERLIFNWEKIKTAIITEEVLEWRR